MCCASSRAMRPATRPSPRPRWAWTRARRRSASVSADFIAREVRVDVADALSGVALVEVRAGRRRAGDAAGGRRPHGGRARPGRPRAGRRERVGAGGGCLDARQRRRARRDPARAPAARIAWPERLARRRRGPRRRSRARPGADLGLSQGPRAAARRQLSRRAPTARSRSCVRPRRSTRYAVSVLESQGLLGLPEQSAGTLRVTARITGLKLRARGGRLSVSARFGGRGEATRLHLLVHDLRGGRWVEACLEHGRPGRAPRAHGPRLGQLPYPS